VQNGYVDPVALERVKEFRNQLMDFLTTRKADLLAKIAKEKALSDTLKAELKTAIDGFAQTWKGNAAR
jgi:F-type H+/Na+-transporting ATPase subunit alpha